MPMQQARTDSACSSPDYSGLLGMDPDSPEGCGGGGGGSHRVRQRLKPWLEAQINSGRFPGVEWVDRSDGIFRITWKHGGRADWSEQDGLIFKEWAIHTGRYREGTDDKLDWPSWKTRLRCALNKLPDIQEQKELSCYDEPNPYRVYKFIDRRAGSGSTSPTQPASQQSMYGDESCGYGGHLLYQPPQARHDMQPNIPNIISEPPIGEASAHRAEACEDPQVCSLGSDLEQLSFNGLLPIDTNISLTNISVDSNINSCPEAMDTHDSLKGSSCHQLSQHVKPEPVEKPDPYYYQTSVSDELTLVIRFRTTVIQQVPVSNAHGCRVFYGNLPGINLPWDPQLFGDQRAKQVMVPYTAGQLDPEQDRLTKTLLDALELGVNIYVDKGSICVLRRCKASVFTAPANREVKETVKVERQHQPVKIFDFSNDFLPAFMRYQQGEGPRPSPQVIIAIGQKFRADVDPYSNLLLSVTVCHPQASHLLAQHVPESPPVEISASSEYEHYLDYMKTNSLTLPVLQPMAISSILGPTN